MTVKYVDDSGVVMPPLRTVSQAAQPTLEADNTACIWIDTDDSNKVYLLFRRGGSDYVKVQLT